MVFSGSSTVKGQTLRIPRRYLLSGALKWWKCQNATDTLENQQGQVVCFAKSTETFSIDFFVKWRCEFKDANISGESVPRPLKEEKKSEFPPGTLEVIEESSTADGTKCWVVLPPPNPVGTARSRSLPPVLRKA